MDDGEGFFLFLLGFGLAVFWGAVAWNIVETGCEEEHNVFDCEWSRTPFTAAIPEVDQ